MAVYVKMIKKFDDEKRVVYQFGPNEKQMGEIEFDKEKKIFNKDINTFKKYLEEFN